MQWLFGPARPVLRVGGSVPGGLVSDDGKWRPGFELFLFSCDPDVSPGPSSSEGGGGPGLSEAGAVKAGRCRRRGPRPAGPLQGRKCWRPPREDKSSRVKRNAISSAVTDSTCVLWTEGPEILPPEYLNKDPSGLKGDGGRDV